jgi:hypothetical protein
MSAGQAIESGPKPPAETYRTLRDFFTGAA